MTTSVACKALHVTPSVGQYVSDPVSVLVNQNGCDQGSVVTSEYNLLEMTEVEYTHLQHIIQSHMEAQAVEQNESEEVKIHQLSNIEGILTNHPKSESDCMASSPPHTTPVGQPSASGPMSVDVQYTISASAHEGPVDIREVKMVLYSDPGSGATVGERTPTSYSEVPDSVLAKVRCAVETARERGMDPCEHRGAAPLEGRSNPAARVCLEKRFNCSPSELSRQQESQAAVLNTFLSMFHHSTDVRSIAMHSKSEKWTKPDKTAAVECAYPCGGALLNTLAPTRSQILQGSKHPDMVAPRNFTFSYRPDKKADSLLRASCIIHTDAAGDQGGINLENKVMGKEAPPVKRAKTRRPRSVQVRVPNIVQGPGDWKSSSVMPGSKPSRRTGSPLEITQRRERHNSKERDRRRRIRLCCDELNLLVPFCNTDTDKATTLQWTTAFLKYIREMYGDSLKQDFQNTFCGKTGIRIKPSCDQAVQDCQGMAVSEPGMTDQPSPAQ
ncbi:transcription factor-like 5 protein [Electrophorus electricus]|uniref:transcription factor-like 5 protein n=1 Tax=Electrophorus electricus TaxID=8005 RepID=UPI0015CFDC2F|nr:transcription factor-like 5 protein [Electrophorus electricus]